MKLSSYCAVSVGLVLVSIGVASFTKPTFYEASIYVSSSKIHIVLWGNLAFMLAIVGATAMKCIFFGALNHNETDDIYDKCKWAALDTFLALTIFREDLTLFVVFMFLALMFTKVFHWIGDHRVEMVGPRAHLTSVQHLRINGLITILFFFDSVVASALILRLQEKQTLDVLILFAFEFTLLALSMIKSGVKYIILCVDARHDGGWPPKPVFVFYADVFHDLMYLILYSLFFCLICVTFGLPVYLIRELYQAYATLRSRVAKYITYRKLVKNMNLRFPDVRDEELGEDRTCIICFDEMTVGKRLPCSHIFHFDCLRTWLESKQICPTCRGAIPFEDANARRHRLALAAADAAGANAVVHPPQPVAVGPGQQQMPPGIGIPFQGQPQMAQIGGIPGAVGVAPGAPGIPVVDGVPGGVGVRGAQPVPVGAFQHLPAQPQMMGIPGMMPMQPMQPMPGMFAPPMGFQPFQIAPFPPQPIPNAVGVHQQQGGVVPQPPAVPAQPHPPAVPPAQPHLDPQPIVASSASASSQPESEQKEPSLSPPQPFVQQHAAFMYPQYHPFPYQMAHPGVYPPPEMGQIEHFANHQQPYYPSPIVPSRSKSRSSPLIRPTVPLHFIHQQTFFLHQQIDIVQTYLSSLENMLHEQLNLQQQFQDFQENAKDEGNVMKSEKDSENEIIPDISAVSEEKVSATSPLRSSHDAISPLDNVEGLKKSPSSPLSPSEELRQRRLQRFSHLASTPTETTSEDSVKSGTEAETISKKED
uniref:RING-type E3 ubiquitin transferase n=1 Tax=Hirondellea gigas TaxID=1518452 RepID=A0A6A7G8P2_9CRUS